MFLTCLFGKPVDLEILVVGRDGREPAIARACEAWVPLPEPMRLDPGEQLLRVSRHLLDGEAWTWIGLYRHAEAIGSSRPGGFYGAGLLCRGERLSGTASVSYLIDSADSLAAALMHRESFTRRLSTLDLSIDFDPVRKQLAPIPLAPHRGLDPHAPAKALVVSRESRTIPGELIDAAQAEDSAAGYSALYIASSLRLAEAARSATPITGIVVRPAEDFLPHPWPTPPRFPAPAPIGSNDPRVSLSDIEATIDQRIMETLRRTAPSRPPRRSYWPLVLLLMQIAVFIATLAAIGTILPGLR
ncbi:hypothetical protein ACFQ1E_20685 [Sphingomonas canadensis]|uniref:Uncharacterized protein n=1 Tax=Sphingomonas canadensis TaxID=1219257 RepID=A0ABW3HE99_9SPHN|nr:hypothetical protein [Sphingomonas canadensis]MCW3838465.1 hypothetical protein [Sphingomonas canadensis]